MSTDGRVMKPAGPTELWIADTEEFRCLANITDRPCPWTERYGHQCQLDIGHIDDSHECGCEYRWSEQDYLAAAQARDIVARIREAYEFYLLDSDPSRGEIFAQQVGQILAAQPQEGSEVLIRNKSGFPWYVQLSPTQVEPSTNSRRTHERRN